MDRVWIRGTSGSGKTTLAIAVAEQLGIEVTDLDELYWLPDWKNRSCEEFRKLVATVMIRPQWVLSGNYSKVGPDIEAAADTMIWLDYSFAVTLWRVLRRTIRRCLTGEPCCNGNREGFRKSFFDKESVIWWMVTTHRLRHRECLAFMAETPPAGQTRRRHRTPRETLEWLASLDTA